MHRFCVIIQLPWDLAENETAFRIRIWNYFLDVPKLFEPRVSLSCKNTGVIISKRLKYAASWHISECSTMQKHAKVLLLHFPWTVKSRIYHSLFPQGQWAIQIDIFSQKVQPHSIWREKEYFKLPEFIVACSI